MRIALFVAVLSAGLLAASVTAAAAPCPTPHSTCKCYYDGKLYLGCRVTLPSGSSFTIQGTKTNGRTGTNHVGGTGSGTYGGKLGPLPSNGSVTVTVSGSGCTTTTTTITAATAQYTCTKCP